MSDEEKEVTEIIDVNIPVEKPLAYCEITGLTVPADDEAKDSQTS